MIEFQNVYKSFKDKHVLEDINFTVNDGEFDWTQWVWKNDCFKDD